MRFPVVILLLALLIWGCSKNDTMAGGVDTESMGGKVTGIINDGDDPASGVIVTLYPHDFNPVKDTVPVSRRNITDKKGTYRFTESEAGVYNIHAFRPEDKSAHIILGTEITGEDDESITLPAGQLEPTAKINLYIDSLAIEEEGYLFIPGTGASTPVTSEDLLAGFVTLNSVPPAAYEEVTYVAADNSGEANVLDDTLEVAPGETAVIGPFNNWLDTARVVINTAPAGADLGTDIYQVPVLIRLNNSMAGAESVFTNSNTKGADLRVSKSDGVTLLPYEIERWDATGQVAEVWVLMDTLYANNQTQHIFLYTGNEQMGSLSSGADVFGNGFSAVWHMNEAGNTDTLGYIDATANSNHATGVHLEAGDEAECIIARCPELDGDNDYLTVEDHPSLDMGDSFTVTLWARFNGAATVNWPRLLDKKSDFTNSDGWSLHTGHTNEDRVTFNGSDSLNPGKFTVEGLEWNAGSWEHIALIIQGPTLTPVINGVELPAVTIDPVVDNDERLFIGYIHGGGKFHWTGHIDEIQISDTLRPADWLKFTYQNQKENSTVVVIQE